MPDKTAKLNLNKPTLADKVSIEVLNENFDILDDAVSEIQDKLKDLDPVPLNIQQGTNVYNVTNDSIIRPSKITGQSRLNLLGRYGNFEIDSNGDGIADGMSTLGAGVGSTVTGSLTTDAVFGSKAQQVKGIGATENRMVSIATPVKPNTKYLVSAYIKAVTGKVSLATDERNSSNVAIRDIQIGETTDTSKYTYVYDVVETTATTVIMQVAFRRAVQNDEGKIDGLLLYELTAAQANEIASMTPEQVAVKYPYVDDIKSVSNPYIIAEGKNLLPPLTEWEKGMQGGSVATILSEYHGKISISGAGGSYYRIWIEVSPNQQYTFAVEESGVGTYPYIYLCDVNRTRITGIPVPVGTFTTAPDVKIAEVILNTKNGFTGEAVFKNPVLNPGKALPFEPQRKSYQFIQTTLRSNIDGTAADEFGYDKNGQPIVLRKIKHISLDGSLAWTFGTDFNGFKYFRAQLPMNSTTERNGIVIKYDGKILTNIQSNTATAGDQHNGTNGDNIYITIADTDSGLDETWAGANASTVGGVVITASQILKALMNGWKWQTGQATRWVSKGDGTTMSDDVNRVTNNIAPGYTPYQLQYQPLQPITEAVTIEGDLLAFKGLNQITMGAGVQVREATKPLLESSSGLYFINGGNVGSATDNQLIHPSDKILTIYKNGNADYSWSIARRGSVNSRLGWDNAQTPNYDQSAAYSVTYFALDMHLLGFAPQSIDAVYEGNLSEVVKDLTVKLSEAHTEIDILRNTKANRQQPLGIAPTLINSWSNYSGTKTEYIKDEFGFVEVYVNLAGGTINSPAFILPIGYRPKENKNVPATSSTTGNGSGEVVSRLHVSASGNVIPTTGGNGYFFGFIRFRAEQ